MKNILITFVLLALSVLTGCQETAKKEVPLGKGKELLSVDFKEGQTLRYKFTCYRNISILTKDSAKKSKKRSVKDFETTEMVVAFKPIKVDPYGSTIVEVTYETITVKRSGKTVERPDAIKSLAGKTLVYTVSPSGKIEDSSALRKLIRQTGDKAFRPKSKWGKIKDPDMISDFVATQWFMWDAISSIEKPIEGVAVGQSWQSKLSIPMPIVIQKARDVTYKLTKIEESEKGRMAVINSSFALSESTPKSWPIPYPDGTFQMSGKFGFYRNYQFLDLTGGGQQIYNIDAGRIEKDSQQYQVIVKASPPFGISLNLQITINQKIITQLLAD